MAGTFIIAEAGVNHNGSVETAHQLIDVAANAGADSVKFQTFKAERLVSKVAPKAAYQKKTTDTEESQLEMLKRLELSPDAHRELMRHCKDKGIVFLSTAFDLDSIDLLCTLGLEMFKIPSGEITNLPYLRKMGSLKKKLILSTGMSTLDEVRNALEALMESGTDKRDIAVLHANTEYPTPMEDTNLRAMLTMRDTLGVRVGYSDHSLGIEAAVAAVALGAEVIEKHFTLDKNMQGPDHKASLEPQELKAMVNAIRNIEKALGDGVKMPSHSEKENMAVVRKSIVAATAIRKGEPLTEGNLAVKRPGTGISPMRWDEVLGTRALRDFAEDEVIEI